MFENGKQNQLPAAAPDAGAGLRPGSDTRCQWNPSPAWLRHLRLVASLHARIPDGVTPPVADAEAAVQDSGIHPANEKKGRRFDSKLPILEHPRAGSGLPPFFSHTSSN